MIPKRITGATGHFKKPKDHDAQRDGPCVALWVRVVDNIHQSAWEPTPAELEILNAGGSVVLSVLGHQPVCSIHVEEVSNEAQEALT